jgi:glutamine synthetase
MADDTMTYRLIVKEIAMKYGWHATFMPKPLFGENGSGCTRTSRCSRTAATRSSTATTSTGPLGRRQGVHRRPAPHAREISAVFAQWVNSYKRLVPGYEAPVYVAWSRRNRSALIRIPLYKPGKEQATRAELRCPDPACNPYLTFAALLHAGLEGIEKGYELPEPMETNLYHLTAEERRSAGIVSLPETLGEAIERARRVRADARRSASTSSTATSSSSARSGTSTACSSRSGSSTATAVHGGPRRRR